MLLLLLVAAPLEAKRRPPAPSPPEGGLIDNVNGVTLDDQGRIRRFSGLLVSKEGNVVRTLGPGDKRPERLDFRLDGRGRTLLPGFHDAHGHVLALGFRTLQLDLAATRSLAEAQAALAAYARLRPTPFWIQGGGWNQETWGLGRFPTTADLDQVVADRPVALARVDGHALVANTAALRAAGITAATRDPPGGRIERDARGEPTGTLIDAAMALVARAVPAPLPRERDEALARAQDILLGHGITATADMGTTAEDWNALRRAGDLGRLRLRVLSYAAGIEPLLAIAGDKPSPWLYSDRLRMVGVKLYADGALGSRGAWLKQPYADAPGTRGLRFLEDAQIRNLMSRAAMDGFQVAVHAIGDAANAQVLDAIDEQAGTYTGDRRWRVEHAQIVDPADLPRFARHGIVASMQPIHQTSDWRMAEARLGPARLGGGYALKAMLDGGARLAFGSDYPVESPNPFAGLAAAITREDASGQPPGGWQPQQRIGIEAALAAFTIGAAHAAFAETRLGTLTRGKRADFILVDRDPLTATPAELRATQVYETWVGGQRAWVRK